MVTTMDINKFTTTDISEDRVNLYLPIQKVDRERRIVSGFATLDNLDKHNDIVTAEASKQAFKSFRGNIREMHMPIAVGKMVNFTEKSLVREDKEYKGIFVEVYVSKGAQDTWEKVLDGTLSGFSIGGNINPETVEKNENGGRVIKDYQLTELSLVDSPANPLANVFSIQKNEEGYTFSGFATESTDFDEEEVESVEKADTGGYIVDDDSITITSSSTDFVVSGADSGSNTTFTINTTPASTINEETIAEKVVKSLENLFTKTIGGNTMTTQTEETAVEEVEATETEEVVESVEDTAVEKAADVSEVEVETTEDAVDNIDLIVEKVLERLARGNESDAEVAEETSEEDASVAKSEDLDNVEETLTKSVDSLAKTVTDKLEELANTISTLKDETNTRLTSLEDVSAVRKSTVTGGNMRKADNESDFWGDSALGGTNTNA